MSSIEKLSDIVDNGLCIGCGLCQSVAGKDKIEIKKFIRFKVGEGV